LFWHSGSSHSHSHDDSSHKHGAEIVTATHDSFTSLSALFDEKALVVPISEVDCTLSGGTATRCLSITLKPEPAYFQIGPWCPRHIDEGSDVSAIWLEGGKVYDTDGSFIQNLSKFYEDEA